MQNSIFQNQKLEWGKQQVDRFVRRFDPDYRLLTFYAAMPLVLTPELLNFLRNQFSPKLEWIAEVDLLLSDLCRPVGYEQYAMDPGVRAYLLSEMSSTLGFEKIESAARLLVKYIKHLSHVNPYLSQHELEAQQWAALVYIEDKKSTVAQDIRAAFQQAISETSISKSLSLANRSEMNRLTRITQELAPQLSEYLSLLAFSELVSRFLRDPNQITPEVLREYEPKLEASETNLLRSLLPLESNTLDLLTYEFDVATISFEELGGDLVSNLTLTPFDYEVVTIESPLKSDLGIDEKIKLIDEALFLTRAYRLDETEKIVLRGTLESRTYQYISKIHFLEMTEVKDTGVELWKDLSRVFGEKVTKRTVSSSLDRWLWKQSLKRHTSQGQHYIEDLGNRIHLEMVKIPAGSFLMGSPEDELDRFSNESPQHRVNVLPFFMGKYPITQAQWSAGAALPQVNRELDPDPSHFKGSNRPVESVRWEDAVEFCERISRYTGKPYRLPSEAEWEYACRAGSTTPFHFGETITPELANYNGTYTYRRGPKGIYREETTEVGSFKVANEFGLYDMHGNVWEWCADPWHENYEGAPSDGRVWLEKGHETLHVMRGGSWNYIPQLCRSACRHWYLYRNYNCGFRVVCPA